MMQLTKGSAFFAKDWMNLLTLACLASAIVVGQASSSKFPGGGAFVPDVTIRVYFLSISVLITLLQFFKKRDFFVKAIPSLGFAFVVIPLLSMVLFTFADIMRDIEVVFGERVLADFVVILICCSVVYLNVSDNEDFISFLWLLIAACIFSDIVDVAMNIFRGSGIFTSITASRINFVAASSAYFLVFESKERSRVLAAAGCVALSFLFLLMSSSKTAISASVLSLSLVSFYLFTWGKWRNIFILVALALLSASGFWISGAAQHTGARFADAFGRGTLEAGSGVGSTEGGSPVGGPVGGPVGDPIGNQTLPLDTGNRGSDESSSVGSRDATIGSERVCFVDRTERVQLWSHAISLFLKAPLRGVGFDGYKLLIPHNYDSKIVYFEYRYPHNVLLDYLAKSGIVGFGLVFVSILACGSIYAKANLWNVNYIFISGIFLFMFFVSMTGGDLYDIRYIWIFAAALSGALRGKLSMVSGPPTFGAAPVNV